MSLAAHAADRQSAFERLVPASGAESCARLAFRCRSIGVVTVRV